MYPTVVSASLRLLSNTYPPFPPSFPPFICQPPRRGTVRHPYPIFRGDTHFDKGLLLVDRGTVDSLGKKGVLKFPPSFGTAVSTPMEHHFHG